MAGTRIAIVVRMDPYANAGQWFGQLFVGNHYDPPEFMIHEFMLGTREVPAYAVQHALDGTEVNSPEIRAQHEALMNIDPSFAL